MFPDWGHFGTTFFNQCRMSAEGLPQLSAVFGGCTAGGAYIPALSDEAIIVEGTGRIHLGGPPIVKAAINEVVDGETLGGAGMHTRVSGVTDYLAADEHQALAKLRQIVRHLNMPAAASPPPRDVLPPRFNAEEIPGIVGTDLKQPYDVREVLIRLVDDSELQEFKPEYGATLVCATAHLHGRPVGILANNGVLFSESSVKGAHFIELCNQTQHPAAVPAEHHRLHGRHRGGAGWHCQAFGQAGVRHGHRARATPHGADWRLLSAPATTACVAGALRPTFCSPGPTRASPP